MFVSCSNDECTFTLQTTLYEVPDRVDGFSGQLGIYGAIQEVNASLAVTLAHTWMKIKSNRKIFYDSFIYY